MGIGLVVGVYYAFLLLLPQRPKLQLCDDYLAKYSHGSIIGVCLLPRCIACYLTAYYVEKRAIYFLVYYAHKKAQCCTRPIRDTKNQSSK